MITNTYLISYIVYYNDSVQTQYHFSHVSYKRGTELYKEIEAAVIRRLNSDTTEVKYKHWSIISVSNLGKNPDNFSIDEY